MFAYVPCFFLLPSHLGSLVVELIKNLPAVQETQVQSLGWENLLEKEMATHSSILAWEISWTAEPGWIHGVTKESDMT